MVSVRGGSVVLVGVSVRQLVGGSVVGVLVHGNVLHWGNVDDGSGLVLGSVVVLGSVGESGRLVSSRVMVQLLVSMGGLLSVVVLLVSLTVDLGLESVSVVSIVHNALVAIGLNQGVVSRHIVSIALLLLLLDVTGLVVMDGIRELVVGGGVVVLILVMTVMQTVSVVVAVDLLGEAVRAGEVSSMAMRAVQTVLDGEGGAGGHGKEKDELEGHF